ncbi:hypothetical protein [Burkholderia gladioli]|uniref:hypothetical protein n=1 Tax=Burkholderia gladioli TaxID=28095 RepID=UPI001641690C|nr:hypothetical protein [Burkholderia gladioli]MBJ9677926.1 hypothetical protein [Burkholderia gladioli]
MAAPKLRLNHPAAPITDHLQWGVNRDGDPAALVNGRIVKILPSGDQHIIQYLDVCSAPFDTIEAAQIATLKFVAQVLARHTLDD